MIDAFRPSVPDQERQRPPTRPAIGDREVRGAYRRTIEEGEVRLGRTWPGLLSVGLVGGLDVSVGVLALFIVTAETGSKLLGALAFTSGFIALTLARSELFTENFLVPVAAVIARNASVGSLARLWTGTLVTNVVGCFIAGWVFVLALPGLAPTMLDVASFYPEIGIGARSFALAVLGGGVITLFTWMERNADSEFGRLLGAVAFSFLLVAGPLNHAIVSSAEMFSALHTGQADFGYLDWARYAGWAALGNLVGGLVFVTIVRLVQVGREEIRRSQDAPSASETEQDGQVDLDGAPDGRGDAGPRAAQDA